MGCSARISDPNFFIPDSGSKRHRIPDPGSGFVTKNLSVFSQKLLISLGKYDPGCLFWSRIGIFFHPHSRGQKSIWSRIRIRKTIFFQWCWFRFWNRKIGLVRLIWATVRYPLPTVYTKHVILVVLDREIPMFSLDASNCFVTVTECGTYFRVLCKNMLTIVAGSIWFWAFRIRIRNYLYGSVSFHQQAKKQGKPWFPLFCDFFWFFYLLRMV